MATAQERFLSACNELGWGDAKNGLWFVAIEEGTSWELGAEARIERHYGHGQYFRDDAVESTRDEELAKGRSQIDTVEAKICQPLSASSGARTFADYKDSLWRDGTRVAHANLYPLGKQKLGALPSHYDVLFGYGSSPNDWLRYRETVRAIRFPRLREARRQLRPQAIVCLGATFWSEFRDAFEIKSAGVAMEEGNVLIHAEDRLILAPHFAYGHIDDQRAAHIAQVLQTWGITLP